MVAHTRAGGRRRRFGQAKSGIAWKADAIGG